MVGPKITVIVQSLSTAQDATGARLDTWTNFASVRGVLSTKSVKERFDDGADRVWSDYTFFMDYLPGITCANRVQFGARIFHITGTVNPQEQNRLLVLDLLEIK